MHRIQNSCIGTPTSFKDDSLILTTSNPVGFFPQEISLYIFSYLSLNELGRVSLVSKKWCILASNPTLWNALDLRKISPLLKVFDELDWATHINLSSFGLSMKDVSPLDKRKEIPILKRCLSSLPIEENSGITFLTIPKGLTFNKLVELAGSPKKGNKTQFNYIWKPISEKLGDIPVDNTYRVVITNNVLMKSRNLTVINQKDLVNKIGCEMPRILEAVTLLVVTNMSSGKRLYNDNQPTYTRTSEQIDGYHLTAGNFTSLGLNVSNDCDYGDYDVRFGVGGILRKH